MTTYTSGGFEEKRPAWWRWFRLKEGRTLYKATITIQHESGSELTLSIEGKDPAVVSRFANKLKSTLQAKK